MGATALGSQAKSVTSAHQILLLLLVLPATLLACVPDLPSNTQRIDAPRVLAVTAPTAEAKPGQKLTLTAWVATPEGPLAASDPRAAQVVWDACTARLRLDEPGPVSAVCLTDGDHHKSLGNGLTVPWTVPADTCRVFGPQPPAPQKGESAGRPVDADVTGGYYAPLRVLGPESWTAPELARLRVQCGLAGATQEVAATYTKVYLPNTPPALEKLEVVTADGSTSQLPLEPTAAPTVVPAGQRLTVRASWASCPPLIEDELAKPCGGNESYWRYDPNARALEPLTEGRSLSWYVTAGDVDLPRTSVLAGSTALSLGNVLTAPASGQVQWLYVVVRDDRGGSAVYALWLVGG